MFRMWKKRIFAQMKIWFIIKTYFVCRVLKNSSGPIGNERSKIKTKKIKTSVAVQNLYSGLVPKITLFSSISTSCIFYEALHESINTYIYIYPTGIKPLKFNQVCANLIKCANICLSTNTHIYIYINI